MSVAFRGVRAKAELDRTSGPVARVGGSHEPVVAAVDLGSNSFHLVVVKAKKDRTFDLLLSEKEMLRIGKEVADAGAFSLGTIQRSAEVVHGFVTRARQIGATEFVVAATAAFREAENASEMVAAIERLTGLKVDVISGHREAELIFLAVRSSMHLGVSPAVVADLGGGSLEIGVGDQRQLYVANSLRLGVGRLISKFPVPDPMSSQDRKQISQYVSTYLEPILTRAMEFQPSTLVLSSGTFEALLEIAVGQREDNSSDEIDNPGFLVVDSSELVDIDQVIMGTTPSKRLRIQGVEEKRNDQLPFGYIVLREILRLCDLPRVTLSPWALREGLVLDLLSNMEEFEFGYGVEDLRLGSALAVAGKFLTDLTHAEKVASLARRIAEQLSEALRLRSEDIKLLECAAVLHDIGGAISQDGHDRHSAYLVESVQMAGFSKEEVALLSSLVRYHKKGTPRVSEHPALAMLSGRERDRFFSLLGILRVADALDRAHQSYVDDVDVILEDAEVRFILRASSDVTVELFGFRKKSAQLSSILGRRLTVEVA